MLAETVTLWDATTPPSPSGKGLAGSAIGLSYATRQIAKKEHEPLEMASEN